MNERCDRAAAVFLAAFHHDPALLGPIRAVIARMRAAVAADGLPPGIGHAIMAAGDGLFMARVFGLYTPTRAGAPRTCTLPSRACWRSRHESSAPALGGRRPDPCCWPAPPPPAAPPGPKTPGLLGAGRRAARLRRCAGRGAAGARPAGRGGIRRACSTRHRPRSRAMTAGGCCWARSLLAGARRRPGLDPRGRRRPAAPPPPAAPAAPIGVGALGRVEPASRDPQAEPARRLQRRPARPAAGRRGRPGRGRPGAWPIFADAAQKDAGAGPGRGRPRGSPAPSLDPHPRRRAAGGDRRPARPHPGAARRRIQRPARGRAGRGAAALRRRQHRHRRAQPLRRQPHRRRAGRGRGRPARLLRAAAGGPGGGRGRAGRRRGGGWPGRAPMPALSRIAGADRRHGAEDLCPARATRSARTACWTWPT